MSTQKAKFELFARLQSLGFTFEESVSMRRIERTLSRWAEAECGDANGNAIERDEVTGKPFRTFYSGANGKRSRYAIADREAGALNRLAAICKARDTRADAFATGDYIIAYHQGDCRGCSLYLVRSKDVPAGADIDSYYSRGVAVCC